MHELTKLKELPLRLEVGSEDKFWGSGDGFKPAKQKVARKILHLTDHAIAKQIIDAKEIQKLLSQNLDNLEACATSTDVQTLALNIFNLYKKADHLADIIDILGRLNKELKFCRRSLPKVQDEKSKAVLLHRIRWLEKGIHNIVEKNAPENLDELLQLKALPVSTKSISKQQTGTQTLQDGSVLYSMSPVFSTELPVRTPPKPILHQTADSLLPPLFEKSSFMKKAVTLPPVSSIPENVETESQIDASDKYWMMDHHRFIYSPNKDILTQENPLSYRVLGLAVPANFVSKMPSEYISSSTLPWMTKQDASEGNFDILREDLEHVLRRTRRMQSKLWKAANLSVESFEEKMFDADAKANKSLDIMQTLQSRGSSYGRTQFSIQESSRAESSASTAYSSSMYSSSDVANYAKENSKDFLPLTRTNMSKQYPHTCDRWTDAQPDPAHVMSQKTIVDQRNLHNKTKLRIFVPKKEKERSSIKRELITPNSIASNRSFRRTASGIRFIEKLKSSGGNSLSQLQKERIDDLMENGITSPREEGRVYAVKCLSFLGVADANRVEPVLIDVTARDSSSAVRFEAAKALLNLGFWSYEAIRELTLHLRHGNVETKLDVLEQIACTSNVLKMLYRSDVETKILHKLVKELHSLVKDDSENDVSFHAAVCLGELCGNSDHQLADVAREKLRSVAVTSSDWTVRAHCLEVLVRRLDFCDKDIFDVIVQHLRSAVKWKDRLAAALLIAHLGTSKLQEIVDEETMYGILRRKLWDDVKREVRLGVSQAVTALGMRSKLLEDLDDSLRNTSEETRSQAVIAMSAAGIRSDTTLRFLVEMLELDASDYVRLQVIRTFQALAVTDIRVVRSIRERERSGGLLAKPARRYLNALDIPLTSSLTSRHKNDANFPSRRATKVNSSRSFTSRFSNVLACDSAINKSDMNSPTKSFLSASDFKHGGPTSPKLAIVSTAVRKSPLSKIFPTNRMSFTDSISTSASNFF